MAITSSSVVCRKSSKLAPTDRNGSGVSRQTRASASQLKLVDHIGWSDADRQHEFLRFALANGAQGCFHSRARGDAIIDHNHRASFDPRTCAPAEVARASTIDFGKLPSAGGFELRIGDPGESDHILIANDDRRSAIHNRGHGELRLRRRANLADQDQVQRRVEPGRDLGRHGSRPGAARERPDGVPYIGRELGPTAGRHRIG